MSKSLVIAEKPSVAADLARALGNCEQHKDYFESDQYVISSAVGHLLEMNVPKDQEAKGNKWSLSNLPVLPTHFELNEIPKTSGRLKQLRQLIKRKDVGVVINACDAGREGELIFRNIVAYTKCKKTVLRLWLQSMTQTAIREGFTKLRSQEELQPLTNAAICRSESDWIVGINGTRAMTAFNSKSGGFNKTTVGRVQTPTLTLIVNREKTIRAFQPQKYWEIIATFNAEAGKYEGRWFDEKFDNKSKKENNLLRPERLWDHDRALQVVRDCENLTGVASEKSKTSFNSPPALYDLTTLQREANTRFGFRAAQTLQIAQSLYERHKLITYPRTDSHALPEDYPGTVRKVLQSLGRSEYQKFSQIILDRNWIKPNKRIFNNSKISDHFAIVPTEATTSTGHLSSAERQVYDQIMRRFLSVFYPPAEFQTTTRITRVQDHRFRTEGKVLVFPGWLEVTGRDLTKKDKPDLVAIKAPEEEVQTNPVAAKENETKPPARFSEATLLGTMEGAGKLVDDDELRAAVKNKGLGTPATRASIIEGLFKEKYIIRENREIQPTPKAFSLIDLLNGLKIPELCSPELTGEWEYKLNQIQEGNLKPDEFMQHIKDMTQDIINKTRDHENHTIPGDYVTLKTPCPKCQTGVVVEQYQDFACQSQSCDFSLRKTMGNRRFEIEEVEKLLSEKKIGPLPGFRSRLGKSFDAMIKITPDFEVKFDFDSQNETEEISTEDIRNSPSIGQCPQCQSSVLNLDKHYACLNSVIKDRSCNFRFSKIILKQEVDLAQAGKILTGGKTDLLNRFVSKRTGKPFEAYLVLDRGTGKVNFEFPPRKGKKDNGKPQVKIDFTKLTQPLGKCPLCKRNVFDTELGYLCEHSQNDDNPCKFQVAKVILQRTIEPNHVRTLLTDGKTELIDQFVSQRSGKPFKAFLVSKRSGKVGFEFPPRETKKKTTPKRSRKNS